MTNKDAVADALAFLNYVGLGRRLAEAAWAEIAENLPVHRRLSDDERDLLADEIAKVLSEALSDISLGAQSLEAQDHD
jgi:hypothetical protein